MKKIILSIILSVFTIISFAQTKIGYVNYEEVITEMPDYKKAMNELETYANEKRVYLENLMAEGQAKLQEFNANVDSYDELKKQSEYTALQQFEQRIAQANQVAQEQVLEKEKELIAPVQEKMNEALKYVAKQNGYVSIIDGSVLRYSSEGNNVTSLVKKRLGI